MRIYDNGIYRDATAEEISAAKTAQASYEAQERTRPLTTEEVQRMMIAQQINTLAVDDATALRMVEYYPEWAANTAYTAGHKVQRGGRLWRARQAHTSQLGWEPEITASLWEAICATHTGTQDDPIPYEGGMELAEGLYYTQDGVLYRCTSGSGQPVYNPLSELVWIYVEVVET